MSTVKQPDGGAVPAVVGARAREVLHRPDQGAGSSAEHPRKWLVRGGEDVFRSIYTRSGAAAGEVLAVTSAIEGEGKTTIALGLAVTIAQDFPELRVVLVETNVGAPVLAADFDVPPAPGLVEFLSGECGLEAAQRATLLPNLSLVPVGTSTTNGSRLLRSSRMGLLADGLRAGSDLVIIDLPGILASSDALLLTDVSDGIVFVVRAGSTPDAIVSEGLDLVDQARVRGVVLNGATSSIPRWTRRLAGI